MAEVVGWAISVLYFLPFVSVKSSLIYLVYLLFTTMLF